MFIAATGKSHGMVDQLLDRQDRRSESTFIYLVATASGTLRDREFCAANGDSEPPEGFSEFNLRYRTLLAEALTLASKLQLPAAGYR